MTKQEKIFREYSVWHAMASMALPAMVSVVVMICYNLADMFFVGLTGDTVQVAAVSVVGPVFNLVMALGSMIGAGGCALVARTLGAGDIESVQRYSSVCCWGGIALGVVFGAAMLVFRVPLLRFLGANEEMWHFANTYLCVLAVGTPAMVFTTAYGNLLRGEGAVKEGMVIYLLSTVSNVVLDPLFILGLDMGVGGAAAATVLSNVIGAVLFVVWLLRCETNLSLSLNTALSKPSAFGSVVALGLPNAASTTLSSLAGAFSNQILVAYGTTAVAAMGAAGKVTLILSMIQMGLCMGVQPLMAYHYGAKNLRRLKEILGKLTLLTVVIGSVLTVVCLVQSGRIVGLFLHEEEALTLGGRMVRLMIPAGPFLGLFYIGTNFLQSSGNAPMATLVSLLRQGIFLIPLLFGLNRLFGITGCVCAHLVSDIASAAVAVVLLFWQYRRLRRQAAGQGAVPTPEDRPCPD